MYTESRKKEHFQNIKLSIRHENIGKHHMTWDKLIRDVDTMM